LNVSVTDEPALNNTRPEVGSRQWQSVTRGEELAGWLQDVSTMPLLREVAKRSMALLEMQAGEHVVEVGCGSGVFLPLLALAVGETGQVVGLDHAATFVQKARERSEPTRWVQVDEGDAYALPYAGQSFDAAHCDRVLMHLDDPSAALAEMCRVVRPGGRVVVAEPDWASIVIDSSDHEAMQLLIQRANTVRRQPYIGRELNRRMAAVGLIDRRIESVPILSLDYRELVTYGLDLSQAADELAAAKRLDRQQAAVLLDALEAASRDATFCAYGGYFVARGVVPRSAELDSSTGRHH
jgi:SAM-dependent methyltransferase